MAKHIPPTNFSEVLTHTDPLPALKDIGAKRAGAFLVDVNEITVLPEYNPRITGTKDYDAHVEGLMASIRENGFMPNKPLLVFPASEEVDGETVTVFYLIAGHSRYEAVMRLNAAVAAGELHIEHKITDLPVVTTPDDLTLGDLLVQTVHDNNVTKPLSPNELAIVVKRLLDNYEMAKDVVARRLNITTRYVDQLLVLNAAPASVKEAVRTGKVSATVAIDALSKHGADAPKVITKAIAEAEAAGKTKATAKSVAKAAPAKPKAGAGKAKVAKAAGKTKKPAGKPADPIKEAAAADKTKAATTEPAGPATDLDFFKGAIDYALSLPKKGGVGLDWLTRFMAEDATATAELESWLGQAKGAFFDSSLRTPVDKEGI